MRTEIINFKYSSIKNQAEDVLDVFIDGDIVDASTQEFYKNWWGDDTSTSFKSLRETMLSSDAKRVNIHINSGGGMMADAFAMHDFIREGINNGKNWHTYGKGMVCSAATYPLLAPLTSNKPANMHISENCFHMIHNASGYIGGSVDEIESYATTIRKFNDTARNLYANAFSKPKETISAWMKAETWWTGEDMRNMGLITADNCTPAEKAITNSIPKEKWLFNNTVILNTINNSISQPPPKNKGMKKNTIVNAIEDAFKKYFTNSTTLQNAKPDDLKTAIINAINEQPEEEPVDPAAISNAVTNAMTGDAFNTAVANAVNAALATVPKNITDAIANATTGFVKTEELEKVKTDLGNKLGTTNRKTKNGVENNSETEPESAAEMDGWNR